MIIFFIGCYNESDITPTEGDERCLRSRKGIMIMTRRLSPGEIRMVFIHCIFSMKTICIGITRIGMSVSHPGWGEFSWSTADANYVKPALEMFKESFLELYPEDFIRIVCR